MKHPAVQNLRAVNHQRRTIQYVHQYPHKHSFSCDVCLVCPYHSPQSFTCQSVSDTEVGSEKIVTFVSTKKNFVIDLSMTLFL
jgi:hypothetical protein